MGLREIVERDEAKFLAWLRAKGLGYYDFEKESWSSIVLFRLMGEFRAEEQQKEQADQQARAIFQAVKGADDGVKGALIPALMTWPEKDRKQLIVMLSGPTSDTDEPLSHPPIVVPTGDPSKVN